MAARVKMRRRVQTKKVKSSAVSENYAMKAWCDLSKPMPIRCLTIDDVRVAFYKQYRSEYGKPVPMELGARIEWLVMALKAEYSKQTRFKFLRDLKGLNVNPKGSTL